MKNKFLDQLTQSVIKRIKRIKRKKKKFTWCPSSCSLLAWGSSGWRWWGSTGRRRRNWERRMRSWNFSLKIFNSNKIKRFFSCLRIVSNRYRYETNINTFGSLSRRCEYRSQCCKSVAGGIFLRRKKINSTLLNSIQFLLRSAKRAKEYFRSKVWIQEIFYCKFFTYFWSKFSIQ